MPLSRSTRSRASRTQLWLEGLGDWRWPGQGGGGGEDLEPPSWVSALPSRLGPARPAMAATGLTGTAAMVGGTRQVALPTVALPTVALPGWSERLRAGWLGMTALVCALVAAWALAAPVNRAEIERLVGAGVGAGASAGPAASVSSGVPPDLPGPLPVLVPISSDVAGSSIMWTAYPSGSLGGEGSFYVYLPPGYARSDRRYPVLYLLHGRDGHANAFLEIGIQHTLDRLIDAGAIEPMIAVMIQDLPGLNNWRDIGRRLSETYVVEVQGLIDRMLRTIPTRAGRAIAGSSYGGFGAMNVALANPTRFAVVESWLGFFNNLGGQLHADAPVIARLGLHAFLYGAAEDPVAVPAEDPEFAAALRAVGAQAQSAIYPGGHSLEKVQEHLATGLLFAGRSLREAQQRAAAESAAAEAARRAQGERIRPA